MESTAFHEYVAAGGKKNTSEEVVCREILQDFLVLDLVFDSYLRILMQPLPFVRKNMSLSLFQEISFTSNLNCSSALERCVLASMKVTTSSLFPTAMV